MSTIWVFDHRGSKHTLYRGENYMKKFCTFLKEHTENTIDFEKKEMLPLTKEKLKLLQDANVSYIRGKRIKIKLPKIINY